MQGADKGECRQRRVQRHHTGAGPSTGITRLMPGPGVGTQPRVQGEPWANPAKAGLKALREGRTVHQRSPSATAGPEGGDVLPESPLQ
jgi:hypothetical protein